MAPELQTSLLGNILTDGEQTAEVVAVWVDYNRHWKTLHALIRLVSSGEFRHIYIPGKKWRSIKAL
jgi:hypothetical protein